MTSTPRPSVLARLAILLLVACSTLGCGEDNPPRFEQLPARTTGIDFNNTIVEDEPLLNPIDFDYLYNGGGVAVGDFDNDDRPDLYFAGNTVANRLYLNRGDFQFEDVTDTARVGASEAWSTGVAVVDINQDGLLDIYVCVAGKVPPAQRANRLFINQGPGANGTPTFEESAAAYGLADTGYSTQAAFFDYDRDGDLDVYILTNTVEDINRNAIEPRKKQGQAASTDRLYQNNGDGTFTDVSREAGIQIEGFGLGVVISDVNQDGWPDIYAANDFIDNDLLYVNNGDGTFTNRIARFIDSQSHSGMGADIADFNNDVRPDIVVLDMLPRSNVRRKNMLSGETYDRFHAALRMGYEPQYMRNTLQLNRGRRPGGALAFSEIGRLAGVHNTDWSWASLLADFDNDGRDDLFVTNGYGKDVTSLDFLERAQQDATFGTRAANQEQLLAAMEELPEVRLSNIIFRNDGALTFTDKTTAWGMGPPSLSNGAAFADLDRDGDLDLVTNNINDEAFVLKNHTMERDSTHYLRVAFRGPAGNRAGLGTKLILYHHGTQQYHDHSPYRGYQSTVEATAHFGMGMDATADSLAVLWPDGRYQLLTDVAANQTITVAHANAAPRSEGTGDRSRLPTTAPRERSYTFEEVAAERGLNDKHDEFEVVDFDETPLLPHQYSKNGPGLAVGDVDGNGLDDVFVGADKGNERAIFLQATPGQFTKRPLALDATAHEDMGALFFDAEGDGDLDLYVVSGSNIAPAGDAAYQDRLYLNDGTGQFQRNASALPAVRTSGSVVTAADYDRDGDLDLFVGSRVIPGDYPLPPKSYLLRNDSEGASVAFTDVTDEMAPALADLGLVTSALWTDFNQDDEVDLLVAGEWMPLTALQNDGDQFTNVTAEMGLSNTTGWWNSLTAGDFDRDGDVDYVAGNLGLNTEYTASTGEPVRIHANDFDEDGELDPVVSRTIQGERYPAHPRDAMVRQIPGMQRRFPSHRAYGEAAFDELFTDAEMDGAYVAEAFHFETSYVENQEGTLAVRPLPVEAQFAPMFGLQTGDYDDDGHLDLLMVGNSYAPDTQTGRYDASTGALFRGDGNGRFTFVNHTTSGFFVDGDAKGLAEVQVGPAQSLVLATQNSDSLRAFRRAPDAPQRQMVALRPLDRYAMLTFEDGRTRRQEFFHGASYLSQSSRFLRLPLALESAVIYDSQGNRRTLDLRTQPTRDARTRATE